MHECAVLPHFEQVEACEPCPKKAVAVNFADVSNLVTDRCDLADGRLKPLLYVLRFAQTVTTILPNVCWCPGAESLTAHMLLINRQFPHRAAVRYQQR